MVPVLLIEPVSYEKKRRYFDILTEPQRWPQLNLQEVKQRLKEIRNYSLDHLDTLLAALNSSLAVYPDIDITFAQDTEQAVDTIKEIARGATIAINKSAVVSTELMPTLVAAGYNVIESYYDEFEPFDNKSSEYWQLPVIPFESRFQSFGRIVDLASLRSNSLNKNGSKDFVGLLGINAISAEEGTIFMLQHMHNVSKIFEQAKELIMVVSLDKIVKNLDAAIFQTRCMATFGSEVLPLTLHGRLKRDSSIDELQFETPSKQTSSKIHLILFDNGRSQILKSSYRELLTCIDCQACTKDCPTSRFFVDGTRWSPRQYIYFFLMGMNPSLDLCVQCQTCETNCPLDIDLPGMILNAKAESTLKQHRSLTNTLLANAGTLENLGSLTAWLANILSGSRPLRWMAEKMLNISRQRKLPRFHHRTFAKWFISREHNAKEAERSG